MKNTPAFSGMSSDPKAQSPNAEIEFFEGMTGATLASWGNLIVFVRSARMDATDLSQVAKLTEKLGTRYPGGLVFVSLSKLNVPVPEGGVRAQGIRLLKELADQSRLMIAIIEGTGFVASATRAAFAGMALLVGRRIPLKIVGAIEEAVALAALGPVESPSGAPARAADVRDVLGSVRARAMTSD